MRSNALVRSFAISERCPQTSESRYISRYVCQDIYMYQRRRILFETRDARAGEFPELTCVRATVPPCVSFAPRHSRELVPSLRLGRVESSNALERGPLVGFFQATLASSQSTDARRACRPSWRATRRAAPPTPPARRRSPVSYLEVWVPVRCVDPAERRPEIPRESVR